MELDHLTIYQEFTLEERKPLTKVLYSCKHNNSANITSLALNGWTSIMCLAGSQIS